MRGILTFLAGMITAGLAVGAPIPSGQIPVGKAEQTAPIPGGPLQLFTWRPHGCAIRGILLVFHGLDRNAADYRDHAISLGQHFCLLVVAPAFDKDRFPTWRYQRGGVVRDGKALSPGERTVDMVAPLAAWVRARLGQPNLPYVLIGHSAGAQFLSRVAAYGEGVAGAAGVVIANPSTWVEPAADVAAPYGFGGIVDQTALARYLALPVTMLLGGVDTGSHNLVTGAEADSQGATRLARGQTIFQRAEAAATAHGWKLGWRMSVVPDVGHDAAKMFASTQAIDAVGAALGR